MGISVIMPVYLGEYTTWGNNPSASNSIEKFIRAVNSFLDQSFKDAELVIVSDGCKDTEDLYQRNWRQVSSIQFKALDKQIPFGGVVRQTGIGMAKGEIICYLDHDDMFGNDHLKIINENFDTDKHDWVYYNDYVIHGPDHLNKEERHNLLMLGRIGTSSIAHKRNIGVVWGDGYGHDWRMIATCLLPKEGIRIPTPQYYVAHIPGSIDF
jgi:glycosyltransferase involved in cell wall biosynthesis